MASKYTVTAPRSDFTGVVAGVAFARGVALVDGDAQGRALSYFRRRGYDVQAPSEPAAATPPALADATPETPKRSASTEAWRAYAVDHGGLTSEEAAAMSRDQLAEKYLGPKDKEGDQ